MEFGETLKLLRSELDITEAELADALNVGGDTVARWERGESGTDGPMLLALIEYAVACCASDKCIAELRRDALLAGERGSVSERITRTLLETDYESILLIDAKTGEARPFTRGRLDGVIAEQKKLGDNVAGVAEYLRKYCADEDVERVIRETSLPYVIERLCEKKVVTTVYSLRQAGEVIHKRVIYRYLDEAQTSILCAMQDMTETYNQERLLRKRLTDELITIREESGISLARYDLATRTLYSAEGFFEGDGYGNTIENVPDELIAGGLVAQECVHEFSAFFESLRNGRAASVSASIIAGERGFRWLHFSAKLVAGDDGQARQAIIAFQDVSDQREQSAVYAKWKQSLEQRDPQSYTLFRCNLSKGASFDEKEGGLLKIYFNPALCTFNERTREYAGRFVHIDDFEAYTALLNSENLLASYYRGTSQASIDYRERLSEGEYRWLRLSVEMAQYPDSDDVEAFLMYENANRAEQIREAAPEPTVTDPLTGVLNRSAFIERFGELLAMRREGARHALLLINIDGFKRLNESFGHAVGDKALADIAGALGSVVRGDDLLGRLGGDEFLICMKNVPGQAVVEQKVIQIQALLRRAFSVDIQLSVCVGAALFPDDGKDFNELYNSVDRALFTAKANGADSYAFFGARRQQEGEDGAFAEKKGAKQFQKRRMLVVEDDKATLGLLSGVFGADYYIETSPNERGALVRFGRFGNSLSVIILSLDIAGVDSMALLDRIKTLSGGSAIPVVVMSRLAERELSLSALRHGACDFILKPIDAELLKMRIGSAVGKAENERLRAQNTYLQTQTADGSQFRTVFENTGTMVVEFDWLNHKFTYDTAISEHIYGRYDDRSLWQILMADMVADVADVKAMQKLIYDLANSKARMSDTLDIMLRTPDRARHWFTMNAFKRVNDMNLTSKIILTFLDVNDEVLASRKLRFQAEHDSLTGLYNRGFFLRLTEETVQKKPASSYILLCCDINDFRFINERFGREEGDRLLRYTAERLLVCSESAEGFSGRLSNDVFAMLLPNAPERLERATAVIKSFFNDYPLAARITGRAGAYIISDTSLTADAMLDLASTASATIKGKFESWLAIYDDSMNERRLREKYITDRMETALADGQFKVYIQPQFHHATGKIVGAEALARWIDPQRGVVSPAEFIPVFEKSGFITKLDEYIWNETAELIGRWMARGHEPVPVSVNVSREDTNDPRLCEKLLAIVGRHGVPVELFRLEITESLFAEDTERLKAVVAQLHEAGFLIEMDDFGSGYSSLNILKDIPVDILKLDMKFFSGGDNPGRGGMIINAVLRMSRWLKMPVIAEGVEQKEHADFLLSIGCPTIQGFLYEKPMPAREFETLFIGNSALAGASENHIRTELDTHSFWDPVSGDSQIFNNYIGPAVVFEYHAGEFEIVRMNRRFIEALKLHGELLLPSSGLALFCEEDRPRFVAAVQKAMATPDEVYAEVRCRAGDGEKPRFSVVLRVIARSDDRALVFVAWQQKEPEMTTKQFKETEQ